MRDPRDHTVTEVKAWVRDTDPGLATLRDMLAHERAHDNRVTLTDWLTTRLDDTDADADADADEPASASEPESDPAALAVDTTEPAASATPTRTGAPSAASWDEPTLGDDDYDPQTNYAWAPGEVPRREDIPMVAVAPPAAGSYAGYWFEAPQPKAVARTKRVDRAIVDGPLAYRGEAPDHLDGETL